MLVPCISVLEDWGSARAETLLFETFPALDFEGIEMKQPGKIAGGSEGLGVATSAICLVWV